MDKIALLVIGLLLCVIGIVNMTGNISTVHSYNRRKVKEEDIHKYGKSVGTGTVIIGTACVADYILTLLELTFIVPILTCIAVVVGLGFILYAQFKYNKGIF